MRAERKDVSDFRSESSLKFCFTKRNRLTSKRDFDKVFGNFTWDLKRSSVRAIVVRNVYDFPRLGIVIPRGALQTAVRRNAVKRNVRESFRMVSNLLPNVDVVVVVRIGTKRKPFTTTPADVRETMTSIWKEVLAGTTAR